MNDRFRFRVWSIREKEMIYNAEIAYDGSNYPTEWQLGDNNNDGWICCFGEYIDRKKDYKVMQCIGLKDKNGRLIYEGDIILSNLDYGGTYFVIVGDVRGYCYDAVAVEEYEQYLKSNKSDLCCRLSATAYHIITDHGPCEVIGNIHENPELMEDK